MTECFAEQIAQVELEPISVGISKRAEVLIQSDSIPGICYSDEQGSALMAVGKSCNGLDDYIFQPLVYAPFLRIPAQRSLEFQLFALTLGDHFTKGDRRLGKLGFGDRAEECV